MLAFSAASPIIKGKLMAMDTRWKLIEMCADDRTERERKEGALHAPRYSPISLYISNDARNKKKYNDLPFRINKAIKKFMKAESKQMGFEVDEKLLNHFSHLWVRDPMAIFPSRLEVDNTTKTDHFENLQSTNWNDVRLKPPPSHLTEDFKKTNIGWRTEFRPMDTQLTVERSFLLIHAVQLFARMISDKSFGLNLYIPMSLANENFERAQKNNAVTEQKFFFPRNLFNDSKSENDIVELTLAEIFEGNEMFIGLNKVLE